MPALVSICERNGSGSGIVTQNIPSIVWKNLDDATTPVTAYNAAISLGLNSYLKFNFIQFSGAFTSLGNVTIRHTAGILPNGIKLMTTPGISDSSQAAAYTQPITGSTFSFLTSYDMSAIDTQVNLIVGPQSSYPDPAAAPGKTNIAGNTAGSLYTNYFVSQLRTTMQATTGIIGPITLQISYDEV